MEAEATADDSQSGPSAGQASSRASSAAGSPFFADAGPGFDPDVAEAEAEPVEEPPPVEELILWTPERIRRVLELQGKLTHTLVGVAERDWIWLEDELDMVCGPLADHANRVPALAALAHLSDDALVAAGFVKYAMRSWLDRTRALQARAAAESAQPQSVTGRTVADDIDPEEVQWTSE